MISGARSGMTAGAGTSPRSNSVAQPLAVEELAARRIPPGPDVTLGDDDQFDRTGRPSGPGAAAGDPEQAMEQVPSLAVRHAPPGDDEHIEVTVGPQATEDGRAVQTDAGDLRAEHVVYQAEDLVELGPVVGHGTDRRRTEGGHSRQFPGVIDTTGCAGTRKITATGRI